MFIVESDTSARRVNQSSLPQKSHIHSTVYLVLLELKAFGGGPILGHDHNLQGITGIDIPFAGRYKGVLQQFHHFFLGKDWFFFGAVAVSNDIVQKGNHVSLTTAVGRILSSFKTANGIVGIQASLAFRVNSAHQIKGVVRKEASAVQSVAEHLCGGRCRHVFSMIVLVDLCVLIVFHWNEERQRNTMSLFVCRSLQ